MTARILSARQSEDGRWTAMFTLVPGARGSELTVSLGSQCACERDITLEELKSGLAGIGTGDLFAASPHGLAGTPWEEFLVCLNGSMEQYGIHDCIDKAHFLAQVAVESDSLRTTAEYRNRDGSYPSRWQRYSGGVEYHGRGLIQLTHDHNYRKYSRHAGVDYVATPELVASELQVAVDSACWFWRHGSAWGDLSPRARSNDFIWITMGVNGGFNHHHQRKQHLQSLARSLRVSACEVHQEAVFEQYRFDDSALTRTRNGPRYWRNQLGGRDAI